MISEYYQHGSTSINTTIINNSERHTCEFTCFPRKDNPGIWSNTVSFGRCCFNLANLRKKEWIIGYSIFQCLDITYQPLALLEEDLSRKLDLFKMLSQSCGQTLKATHSLDLLIRWTTHELCFFTSTVNNTEQEKRVRFTFKNKEEQIQSQV